MLPVRYGTSTYHAEPSFAGEEWLGEEGWEGETLTLILEGGEPGGESEDKGGKEGEGEREGERGIPVWMLDGGWHHCQHRRWLMVTTLARVQRRGGRKICMQLAGQGQGVLIFIEPNHPYSWLIWFGKS